MGTTKTRWLKFFSLSAEERRMLLEAAFWLGVWRLGIFHLPFRWVAPLLGEHMKESAATSPVREREVCDGISWAVTTMGNRLPWECTCLVLAASAKMMLNRRKMKGTLYLGVARTEGLSAHAWLRCGETVLTGKRGMERFTVVASFS